MSTEGSIHCEFELSIDQLKQRWDELADNGTLRFSADTLATRTRRIGMHQLEFIHNACRDQWDARFSSASTTPTSCPYCSSQNPQLGATVDGVFSLFANRFPCLQYQMILAPTLHRESIDVDGLSRILRLASLHPECTFFLNTRGSGTVIKHTHWMLSFHKYTSLTAYSNCRVPFGCWGGIVIFARALPTFVLEVEFCGQISSSAQLLCHLAQFCEFQNFNILIAAGTAYFVPREAIEIPTHFPGHRFGALEVIGTFVMKSRESLESAKPKMFVEGMSEVSASLELQLRLLDLIAGSEHR